MAVLSFSKKNFFQHFVSIHLKKQRTLYYISISYRITSKVLKNVDQSKNYENSQNNAAAINNPRQDLMKIEIVHIRQKNYNF